MDELLEMLHEAGLEVVPPCGSCPKGFRSKAKGVDVVVTGTAKDQDGGPEVDAVRRLDIPAVAYVQRKGRVWLIADGPTKGDRAHVYVGAADDGDITEAAQGVANTVVEVLMRWYGLTEEVETPPAKKAAAKKN